MFSTEGDIPWCSFRASPLKADEEADPALGADHTHTPNFSIRDYAYASRSKGVETNWPFPRKFLKTCLKHGIKDPLPPFEPPDLVRSQCRREEVDLLAERIVAQVGLNKAEDVCSTRVDAESVSPPEELVPEAQYQSQKEDKGIVDQVVDDKAIGDAGVVPSVPVTSHDRIEVEFARPQMLPEKIEISRELSRKKCKLVLKLSAISQSRRAEDIASTSSTVSDPMASKVCPVCKLFSSSSNTTLNAHIDQCLSMESNTAKLDNASKTTNLRVVKPRKKRLMVDIYKTASYCTLEDLDKRNGTTWARDLAIVAPAGEPSTETKRPRLSPVDIRHDGDEAVYVDSNGIKLRILSKSSDMPPVMPREESKPKKHAIEFNEEKGVSFGKKKQFESKNLKHMKLKQLSKKLSSFEMMPRREIQAPPAKDYHAETRREKEEAKLPIDARKDVQSNGCATLGRWVCSKRSDLPKKMKKTMQKLANKSPLLQTNQTDLSGPFGARSHMNLSWSTEDLRSSPKAKGVDSLQTISNEKRGSNSHVPKAKLSSGSTSANSQLRLKLSRSCTTSISSLRNTREEHPSNTQKPDNAHHVTTRTLDSSYQSMKAKKTVSLKKNIFSRSYFPLEAVNNDDTGEKAPQKFRKRRSLLVASKRRGEPPLDVNGTTKKVRTHRSNFSFSTFRSGNEETMHQKLSKGSNLLESEKERDTLEQEPLEAERDDVFTSNSMDDVDDDHARYDTLISDHIVTDSTTDIDPKPFGGKYVQSVSESESHEEPTAPRLYDNNELQSNDLQKDNEVETASAQESSACLTSHGEVILDVPPENSSATSCQIKSDKHQTPVLDREPSFSPGSTTSTISRRFENAAEARGREIEKRNEDVEMISVAKEPEQILDGQRCCCSRREGLPREYPFARQSSMPGISIVPRVSSFVSYPSMRTESPTESTKLSTSFAVKIPAYSGLGSNSTYSPSKTPSTPNSVLRLMGKDLMVLKEESSQPSNAQPSAASENPLPSPGFVPTHAVSNQESFWYNHSPHLQTGSSFFIQPLPMNNRQLPMHASLIMKSDPQPHQQHMMAGTSSRTPYTMNEVIVIDDSPDSTDREVKPTLPTIACSNPMSQPRLSSSFPSPSQYLSRDSSSGFRPLYPKPCPVKSMEGLRPLMPSPFYFQSSSTGHVVRPVYYP